MYVTGVRILSPSDFDKLLAGIPKKDHKTIFEVLFWTGMRYVEMQRFHDHPEWIMKERNAIHLPEEAQRKGKRTQKERYIPIAPQLKSLLPYFHDGIKPPSRQMWGNDMKRWAKYSGLNPYGMSAKTTRKTIESWMLVSGMPEYKVYLRAGHDPATSLKHYQGLVFTAPEIAEIKTRLAGW